MSARISDRSAGPVRAMLIHRYFWPDTPPYAVMLRAIASHWADAGHKVEVLTSQPSYKPETAPAAAPSAEQLDGFRVRRLRMGPDRGRLPRRLWNTARFTLSVTLRVLLGPRRELVMCSTVPQVALGWAVSWACRWRGSAFVYHCMDLHPEIGRLSGEFAHPAIYRLLMRLDQATCRRATVVVVLSDDMREALLERDPRLAPRIVVINNFDLPEYDVGLAAASTPVNRDETLVTVAFAGNLGRFQGLDTVVDAALSDRPGLDRLRLILMGEGAAKAGLRHQVADAPSDRRHRIVILPHGSSAGARALMRVADWGLVSLAPEVYRYAYPSKAATYLSEGLPVLAGVEPVSAIARDMESWGIGIHLPLDSPQRAADVLVSLASRGPVTDELREQARQVWRREFAVAGRLARWDELVGQVIGRDAHAGVPG